MKVKLGDMFEIGSGGTPSKTHPEYYGGDIPWVKTGDLKSEYLYEVEDFITEEGLNNSSAKVYDTDIASLEEILWNEIGTREDYEQEIGKKPLGEFVREIIGLDMKAAKEAFSDFLTGLDSRQIYFVNQIVEYIVHNGVMKDLSVLQEPPFTDHGSVVEIFTDMNVWMGIRKVIDTINSNASA